MFSAIWVNLLQMQIQAYHIVIKKEIIARMPIVRSRTQWKVIPIARALVVLILKI